MNFTKFESGIESPALKDVAAHWNEARRERRMPAWADIKPARIAPHLSIVWSFRYDPEKDEFAGRLVGDRIARRIGKGFKGLSPAEVYEPDMLAWALPRFRRVVQEPALYRHAGVLYRQQAHDGLGERIMMPLSDDGVTGDSILGATLVHDTTSMPMSLTVPPSAEERWYSLDGEA
jgi:hypothetical protein